VPQALLQELARALLLALLRELARALPLARALLQELALRPQGPPLARLVRLAQQLAVVAPAPERQQEAGPLLERAPRLLPCHS
jgi:hypothetical protein